MPARLAAAFTTSQMTFDVMPSPHTSPPLLIARKNTALADVGRIGPLVDGHLDPSGNRHGSNVTTLADQIGDDPMILALLHRLDRDGCAAKATSEQHRHHSAIPLSAQRLLIEGAEETLALFGREPVAEAYAQPPHAFDAADAGGQFGAQQAGVGRLIGDTPNGSKSEVDGRWCEALLFEMDSVAEHYGPVESQPGLGTVPVHELVNRVIVGSLCAGRGQCGEHGGLGLLQIGKRQGLLGSLPFVLLGSRQSGTASFAVPSSSNCQLSTEVVPPRGAYRSRNEIATFGELRRDCFAARKTAAEPSARKGFALVGDHVTSS